GLKTPGCAARSVSVSDAPDTCGAFGGRSRPPLRPQPPSASAVTLSRMMAHPDDDGRQFLITTESPMRAAPYKECPSMASADQPRMAMKLQRNFFLTVIFALFPAVWPR